MDEDNGMVIIEVSRKTYTRIQEDKEILSKGNTITDDFTVKNVGDATAHNVTLIDLIIDGKVLYNNRITEWGKYIEPGETIHDSPDSTFIGFGIFTATMTVTCDEGVNGTGSGNGFILGPIIFIP